ncbi:MAG: CoA-binding protein [Kiritimatiellia bacterium]
MNNGKQRVVVLGASPKPERYSNRAVRLLVEHGHEVLPVNPAVPVIEDLPVIHSLDDISGHVDTVTLYVAAGRSSPMADSLVGLHPDRVIFNPGAENPALKLQLESNGIRTEDACTLVLLNTEQF